MSNEGRLGKVGTSMHRDVGEQVGRFIRWGQAVSIDQARRVFHFLPIAREEDLVEFDSEGAPTDEELDMRISSY